MTDHPHTHRDTEDGAIRIVHLHGLVILYVEVAGQMSALYYTPEQAEALAGYLVAAMETK